MNRLELEIKLNQDRAWTLEKWLSIASDDLTRDITTSRHDPNLSWSAKDHLAHLAGIEAAFNAMIRRYLHGDGNPITILNNPDGSTRSREEVLNEVHRINESWVQNLRDKSLSEIVALGQRIRSETLLLISGMTDEQLLEKLPGAPWGDGTIGGVLAINGEHARQHHGWVSRGLSEKRESVE